MFRWGRSAIRISDVVWTGFSRFFRRVVTYTDKILKGAKPADLPVEQPTKFKLELNLKTANALGIGFPESLILSADEMIGGA
jgi:putative ABC transport system substrate-binding protein